MIALSIIGAFGVTAYLLAPGLASGAGGEREWGTAASAVHRARVDHNQQVIEGLSILLASSAEVMAVHQRDGGSYLEVLLRTHQSSETDDLAVDELALISHSEILQTITLYTVAEAESSGGFRQTGLWGWPEPSQRAFTDRWRSHPRVRGRIIATGVSDVQLVHLGSTSGSARLRLSLTWAAESADGKDEASSVVEVRLSSTLE